MHTPPDPYGRGPYAQVWQPYGPPAKDGSNKVIAIVVGLIGVLAIGGAALVLTHGVLSGSTAAAYKLAVPPTVDKGRYHLHDRMHGQGIGGDAYRRSDSGMHGMTGVGGFYDAPSSYGRTDLLDFDGGYGTVDDPVLARRTVLRDFADSDGASTALGPQQIVPGRSGEPLTCEILMSEATTYVPVCAWADSHTVAAVAETDRGAPATSPSAVDLDAFAHKVDTIRDEVRVPVR